MKTVETIATVNTEGKLTIELISDLSPGSHKVVVVIDETLLIETQAAHQEQPQLPEVVKTAWTVLREQTGTVTMPADWSTEHDHYLYGTPKRELPSEL